MGAGDGDDEELKIRLRREVWARFPAKQKYDDVMLAIFMGLVVGGMLLKVLQ